MGVATLAAALILSGTPANPADALPTAPNPVEIADARDPAQPFPETPPATPDTLAPATPSPAITAETPASPAPTPPPESDQNDIVVTARHGAPPGDPLIGINGVSYEAVQAVDEAIIAPVAHGYEHGIPKPVRSGIHNFLNNLDEPIVFVNFLLQLKPGKAAETLGRFAINSTVGVGGLIDVAKKKPFNLPRRSNGLADTLGYYGVGPGPYFFLPLIGPTTLRDMAGRIVDLSLVPTVAGKPFNDPIFALGKGTISSLDERVENDEQIRKARESADPYTTSREYYLQKRREEIAALHSKKHRHAQSRDTGPAEAETAPVLELAPEPAPPVFVPVPGPAPEPVAIQ